MKTQIDRILVPVDFSEDSRNALRYALGLAERLGASLTVLHMNFVPAQTVGLEVVMTRIPDGGRSLREYTEDLSRQHLDEMVSALSRESSVPMEQWVRTGDPAQGILEAAKDFDLVVMGTHGRTGIDHWLIGSVAEKVVRKSTTPVLTIRYRRPK